MSKKADDIINDCGHRTSERKEAFKSFPSSMCPACLREEIDTLKARLEKLLEACKRAHCEAGKG